MQDFRETELAKDRRELDEIMPADPRQKRKVAILGVLTALLPIALDMSDEYVMSLLKVWFSQLTRSQALNYLHIVGSVLPFITALPMVAGSLYFFRYGQRIYRAGRWPLPHEKLIRDIRVVRGREARKHAYNEFGIATILFLGGIYLGYLTQDLVVLLLKYTA